MFLVDELGVVDVLVQLVVHSVDHLAQFIDGIVMVVKSLSGGSSQFISVMVGLGETCWSCSRVSEFCSWCFLPHLSICFFR